eukprot:TRINITY_DN44387_c0_g1_i1.p1 TRINITY_DN44387_c0_g1~~TRINITY_DN44387_c0_g1_i1.p1  ORF type:complete len:753 (+),score=120.28 TRINITY_DN44387_c0_g1_i1:201-2459(+)
MLMLWRVFIVGATLQRVALSFRLAEDDGRQAESSPDHRRSFWQRMLKAAFLDRGTSHPRGAVAAKGTQGPEGRVSKKASTGQTVKHGPSNDAYSEDLVSDSDWSTLAPGDIHHSHVDQGRLGDCYFLAAVIAVAYNHPELIRGMFERGSLMRNDKRVYTTRWVVDGRLTRVAVDDMLPINSSDAVPFFVKEKDGHYWPLILEKAWAKIYGSFKAIEEGFAFEVLKAITRAPVEVHDPAKAKDHSQFWKLLTDATDQGYPMAAGTKPGQNALGLEAAHAFAVLGARTKDGSQLLEVVDPQGRDKYAGKAPRPDEGQGSFYVTYDEFLANFDSVSIANVFKGYSMSQTTVSTMQEDDAASAHVALEFSVEDSDPFVLQLAWPSSRILSSCGMTQAEPIFTVAVAKADDVTKYQLLTKAVMTTTDAATHITLGKGKYVVFVATSFPNWVQDFVVNIYSKSEIHLDTSKEWTDPVGLFIRMCGLCDAISVPETGQYEGQAGEFQLDRETFVNGVPVYRASDKDQQLQLLYWDAKRVMWQSNKTALETGSNDWKFIDTVDNAKHSKFLQKGDWTQAECQQKGKEASHGKTPHKHQHKRETLAAGKSTLLELRSVNPTDACANSISRLETLNNGEDISEKGSDEQFAESEQSIAPPGAQCEDAGTHNMFNCSTFNSWRSMEQLRELQDALKKSRGKGCVGRALKPWERSCIVDTKPCKSTQSMTCSGYKAIPLQAGKLYSPMNPPELCEVECEMHAGH